LTWAETAFISASLAVNSGRTLGERRHRRVGGLLHRAQVLDLLEQRAPRGVGAEHGVQVHLQVLLGDRRAHEVGGFADKFGVEHG
jgi:hypothetical protein